MNTRLEQFLAAENLSQSQFADTINVARASVSHILAGRNKPGWDFLTNMMKHYPNLNMEWLLSGNGKMYKNQMVEQPKPASVKDTPVDLFNNESILQDQPPITLRESNIPVQQVSKPADSSLPQASNKAQSPIQVIDTQRKITKIMVFYDDNTFIEIK